MSHILIRLSALLVACGVYSQIAAAENLAAGDHQMSIVSGRLQRSYIVHIPPQADTGKPLPVVINLHGGGGNARGHQAYVRMDPLADREGFIVVYPNGTGRLADRFLTWNAGTCCGYARDRRINDVGFIAAVLDNLEQSTAVDKRRVYATGMSNGAMMAYRLAAELSERIAAIAPVAGAMVLPVFTPKRPMPVMHIHSVDDPRAVYAGGLGPPMMMAQTRVMHTSVMETLQQWADADHCKAKPHVIETRHWNGGPNIEHTAEKLSFAPCASGVEVVHWRLTGAGHVWPGGRHEYVPAQLGAGTDVIDANTEIWKFFSRYTLPLQK